MAAAFPPLPIAEAPAVRPELAPPAKPDVELARVAPAAEPAAPAMAGEGPPDPVLAGPLVLAPPPPLTVVAPPAPVPEPAEAEVVPVVLPPELPPPPVVASKPEPPKSKGRPVAGVGDEVISLPELTRAVKARLAELGPGVAPTRRQVIALARSVLKGLIIRSLVEQEAAEKLGGTAPIEAAKSRIATEWAERELPAVLRREGVATEAELRARLARGLSSPEALREDYAVRSLAAELIRLEGSGLDFEGYLDRLRKRRAITSIMSPAELAAAGRKAATGGDDAP